MDYQKRKPFDWVVLELNLEENDIRTRINFKLIGCNFDYDFEKEKDSKIIIAGYPRNVDFENDL